MKIIKFFLLFIFITVVVYINKILKQPGNTFTEKYRNLVKQSDILVEKAKKGEL